MASARGRHRNSPPSSFAPCGCRLCGSLEMASASAHVIRESSSAKRLSVACVYCAPASAEEPFGTLRRGNGRILPLYGTNQASDVAICGSFGATPASHEANRDQYGANLAIRGAKLSSFDATRTDKGDTSSKDDDKRGKPWLTCSIRQCPGRMGSQPRRGCCSHASFPRDPYRPAARELGVKVAAPAQIDRACKVLRHRCRRLSAKGGPRYARQRPPRRWAGARR